MQKQSKPGKGNNKPATKTNKAVESAPAKPTTDKPKATSGKSKLQIITTDFSGKTDWTNKFAMAVRGEGDEFLPGWYVTHFPTKEARDAEIAALSKGIDQVQTRANAPVLLNGKQVFFLRWKGGYRESKA